MKDIFEWFVGLGVSFLGLVILFHVVAFFVILIQMDIKEGNTKDLFWGSLIFILFIFVGVGEFLSKKVKKQ